MQNWQQRLIMGSLVSVLAIVALFTAYIPYIQFLFIATAVAIITIASWELLQLTIKVGATPLSTITLSCVALYLIAVFTATQIRSLDYLPELALLITLFVVFLYHFYSHEHPINTIANSLFPLAFLAVPLGTAIQIVYYFPPDSGQDGRWWLFFLLIVVKINDVAAYVVGKTIGKHPLTRYISPKKTWEGAIAGFAAALVTGAIFHTVLLLPLLSSILLAGALTLAAQFGDLSESLLKRDAGTKDSNTLPGLGGILDIVDALVFSSPLMYIFLKFYFTKACL